MIKKIRKLLEILDRINRNYLRGKERIKVFLNWAIPKWFIFLGWLFLLGGLTYIYRISNSIPILVLLVISYLIIFFFLFIILSEIRLVPRKESEEEIAKENIVILVSWPILAMLELSLPVVTIYFLIKIIEIVISEISTFAP